MKVILLTGSELRHTFFRKWMGLSDGMVVLRSFCEGLEKSLSRVVQGQDGNELRLMHLRAREQSEEDFFRIFVETAGDRSNPVSLTKGEINAPAQVDAICAAEPDLLICYGSSIIREPLLSAFRGRFLNIHLGLSPYYRGSGTNFWPLVNGEPEYVGGTFMHIDAGVDTGEVIHQVRARIVPGDTAVQIGNRLIKDMAFVCPEIVRKWKMLQPLPQIPRSGYNRVYKKKDYTEQSVQMLYKRFSDGLVQRYLAAERERCAAVPLLQNPAILRS